MFNRSNVWIHFLLVSFIVFLNSCGQKDPAAPTPDLQAKMKADTEMETWLTDIRLSFFFASEGLATLDDALVLKEKSNDESRVKSLVDHFNAPGNLVESLRKNLEKANTTQISLASISGIDQESFSNLTELNKTLTSTIQYLTLVPDNPADFREKVGTLRAKFASIENLLTKKFPNSSAMMTQRKSPESPEFRKFKQLLEPKIEPIVNEPVVMKDEPRSDDAAPADAPSNEPSNEPVTPGGTAAPSKVWRDAQGVIHMGQTPPDGVLVEEPRGSIAQGSSLPLPTVPPVTTIATATPAIAPASELIRDETGRIILKNVADPTPQPQVTP